MTPHGWTYNTCTPPKDDKRTIREEEGALRHRRHIPMFARFEDDNSLPRKVARHNAFCIMQSEDCFLRIIVELISYMTETCFHNTSRNLLLLIECQTALNWEYYDGMIYNEQKTAPKTHNIKLKRCPLQDLQDANLHVHASKPLVCFPKQCLGFVLLASCHISLIWHRHIRSSFSRRLCSSGKPERISSLAITAEEYE